MRSSGRSDNLIVLVPILTVVASFGIVLQESVRYDMLSRELASAQGQYAVLQKKVKKLRHESGSAPAESFSTPVEDGHHHDGDGD